MYDTSIEVEYSNNTEFRESLRKVFKMNCIEEKENEVMDKESRDELLYDEERVNILIANAYIKKRKYDEAEHILLDLIRKYRRLELAYLNLSWFSSVSIRFVDHVSILL